MRGLPGNLLLATASVLLTLVAAEPLVRFFRPFNMNTRAFAMRYDPVLGWSMVPHNQGVYAADHDEIEKLNSRGIRGSEHPYEKAANEYRVLVIGDSFAEGRLVGFRDTTFQVLERQLRQTGLGPRFEVVGAGTGGYSTDQEVLFFETEGRKYSPDVTVLMFYENDVWYNAQPRSSRGNKPLFELIGEGELRLTRVPVPRGDATKGGVALVASSWAGRLLMWLQGRSAVYRLVHDGLVGLRGAGERKTGRVPDEFRVWQRDYDDETRHAWRVTEALLRRLQLDTREIGSELVVLYVPTKAEIYPRVWAATRRRYGLSEPEWDITRLARELADMCRRNGIHFVDPSDTFRAEAAKPLLERTPLYFESDPHWTPAGHAIAGTILATYVEKTFLAPRRSDAPG